MFFPLPPKSFRSVTAVFCVLAVLVAISYGTGLLHRTAATLGLAQVVKPIYGVDTTEKKIALSLDASWGAEYTKTILDTLDKYDIKTTFFLVNIWMEDYPDLTKEISKRGHEIGLHSTTHSAFTELTAEQMKDELTANAVMIKDLTKKEPTLFRPPYGDYDDTVIETANSLGYDVIQWSVDSLDWKGLSADEIYQRVMGNVENGSIVLMHNNGEHTAEALNKVIPALLDKGYTIVPVSQLIYDNAYTIDNNGIQHKSSLGK